MIDEKKLEEAAKAYFEAAYGDLRPDTFLMKSFKQGAHWAIQEFLKDLWHPVEEEPIHGKGIILLGDRNTVIKFDHWHGCYISEKKPYIRGWEDFIKEYSVIKRWCYTDDLLPKEGGEQ